MSSIDAAMRELRAGVAHWYTRPLWPRDFHNLDYRRWFEENPRGEFSLEWWKPFRRTLHDWIAIRPLSYAAVTENLVSVLPDLSAAWKEACEPVFDREISEVKWEKIEAFPKLVIQPDACRCASHDTSLMQCTAMHCNTLYCTIGCSGHRPRPGLDR